jgi:hypothetical protein
LSPKQKKIEADSGKRKGINEMLKTLPHRTIEIMKRRLGLHHQIRERRLKERMRDRQTDRVPCCSWNHILSPEQLGSCYLEQRQNGNRVKTVSPRWRGH